MSDGEPERPTCETCPYFQISALEEEAEAGEGFCKRFPPTLLPDSFGKGYSGYSAGDYAIVDTMRHWATTGLYDGCGEHPDFPAYIAALRGPGPSRWCDRCRSYHPDATLCIAIAVTPARS